MVLRNLILAVLLFSTTLASAEPSLQDKLVANGFIYMLKTQNKDSPDVIRLQLKMYQIILDRFRGTLRRTDISENEKRSLLYRQFTVIENKIRAQEADMNPILKTKIENYLKQVRDDINRKDWAALNSKCETYQYMIDRARQVLLQ